MEPRQLRDDLWWVGVHDLKLRVFDIIMESPYGTTYNAFVLKGSAKTVLVETAKVKFFDEYLEKVQSVVDLATIDYLIIDHTEPDHTGSIERLLEINPYITVVGSAVAISLLKEIVNHDFTSLVVKDNDTLSLGDKTLRFFSVPNLHWPDTIYTYVEETNVLFTCDSYGAHYCFDGILYSEVTNHQDFDESFKYYYDCIMGPYKSFMRKALQKLEPLHIDLICTGHGPLIDQDIEGFKEKYRIWSTPIKQHTNPYIVIPYVTSYGYTEQLKDEISKGIQASGSFDIVSYDMVYANEEEVLAEMDQADGILFGTPTIVGEALYPIWNLTTKIFATTHGGKFASAFGSYGWSGEGVPHIMERLKQLHLKLAEPLKIRLKPSESDLVTAFDWGYNFGCMMLNKENTRPKKGKKRMVKCLVCGEVFEEGVDICPVCGVDKSNFIPIEVEEVSFKKNKYESYIILGNGAAGVNAAQAIRERNDLAEIEILSEETVLGYNRPMLTKAMLGDLDASKFAIKDPAWYEAQRIKNTLGVRVVKIDPWSQMVEISDGTTRSYDKLIYALGARSFVPPIPNVGLDRVLAIRSLQDVQTLRSWLPDVQQVVVIGGGVLGLEAAWEMKKAGKEVHVLELMPSLMPRQLDSEASTVLSSIVRNNQIEITTNVSIAGLEGETCVEGVRLGDGSILPAQMVLISTGVRANSDLAQEAGLAIERAIVVNASMQTNEKNIYACGDCAQCEGINYAIWPEAVEQGRIAGANAAGDALTYQGVSAAITFNGMNTKLYANGDVGKVEGQKYRMLELLDQSKQFYQKYYFQNNQLVGAILLGDTSKLAEIDEALVAKKQFESMFKW
ncbi:MAG: FAD-dependent oxidoreductase [Erysipelotrichaceae bacterium]